MARKIGIKIGKIFVSIKEKAIFEEFVYILWIILLLLYKLNNIANMIDNEVGINTIQKLSDDLLNIFI